jgi:uncharacterized alkaline shock family protein YloU
VADFPDPADRGHLTLRDKAVERIVYAAALEAGGIERESHGLAKIAGRELPRAEVVVSGDRVRANVDVAAQWGRPLAATAAEVRDRVTRGLAELGGLTVDAVTVHVRSIVGPQTTPHRVVE